MFVKSIYGPFNYLMSRSLRVSVLRCLAILTRAIFIGTPHRGSYMASNPIVKFGDKFINLPGGLGKSADALAKLREPRMLGTPFTMPTARDNMDAFSANLISSAPVICMTDSTMRFRGLSRVLVLISLCYCDDTID